MCPFPCDQRMEVNFDHLIGLYLPCFSCALYFCVGMYTLVNIGHLSSCLQTELIKGKTFLDQPPQKFVGFLESFSFQGTHLLQGWVCIISAREVFTFFFFSGDCCLFLPHLTVSSGLGSLVLLQATKCSCVLCGSQTSKTCWFYYCSKCGETEIFGSPTKIGILPVHFLFLSKGKSASFTYLPNCDFDQFGGDIWCH